MMVREPRGAAEFAIALFMLELSGFQPLMGPHCWPPKYRVSLRGRSVTSAKAVPHSMSTAISRARILVRFFILGSSFLSSLKPLRP